MEYRIFTDENDDEVVWLELPEDLEMQAKKFFHRNGVGMGMRVTKGNKILACYTLKARSSLNSEEELIEKLEKTAKEFEQQIEGETVAGDRNA